MSPIALGVTGGIGAYKAVEVVRGLQKRGHEVVAVMTASATRFVGPVTFEAITRRRVITDQFEPGANADIEHIALASTIDLLVIAPATANILAKLANGMRRGAHVTLVAGPTAIEPPAVRELVRVRSAAEMHAAVLARADAMDVAVLAAAVADYAPAERAAQKVPKGGDTMTLVLKKTPDILADLGARRLASATGPVLVGFAAETHDGVARAKAKRERKHADLIVANDVSRADAGFGVETNAVVIIGPDGPDAVETLPLQSKARVAAAILDRVEPRISRPAKPGHHMA